MPGIFTWGRAVLIASIFALMIVGGLSPLIFLREILGSRGLISEAEKLNKISQPFGFKKIYFKNCKG